MIIYVRTIEGRELFFWGIDPKETTVWDFKIEISERIGVEPLYQRLIYKGREMLNEFKLEDFGIKLQIGEYTLIHFVKRNYSA